MPGHEITDQDRRDASLFLTHAGEPKYQDIQALLMLLVHSFAHVRAEGFARGVVRGEDHGRSANRAFVVTTLTTRASGSGESGPYHVASSLAGAEAYVSRAKADDLKGGSGSATYFIQEFAVDGGHVQEHGPS